MIWRWTGRFNLLIALALASPAVAGRTAITYSGDPSKPEVAVTLAWDYKGIPKGMRIYELTESAANLPLWHTASVHHFDAVPAAGEIRRGVVKMRPGASRRFLLVYRNSLPKDVRFFAAPHHVHPSESSLGFEFACLCFNHIYAAPALGYWFRVVELTLKEDFAAATLEVRHALVAYPRKKAAGD